MSGATFASSGLVPAFPGEQPATRVGALGGRPDDAFSQEVCVSCVCVTGPVEWGLGGVRSKHWGEGFEAGVRAWRPTGIHAVPVTHPRGGSREGSDWFAGCVEGLEHAAKAFGGVGEKFSNETK